MNSRLRWRSPTSVDLAGEQIDPGQQAERAMAFVPAIPREARMAAWHWRQIRYVGDGLIPASRRKRRSHRLLRFLRLAAAFFRPVNSRQNTELPPSWVEPASRRSR